MRKLFDYAAENLDEDFPAEIDPVEMYNDTDDEELLELVEDDDDDTELMADAVDEAEDAVTVGEVAIERLMALSKMAKEALGSDYGGFTKEEVGYLNVGLESICHSLNAPKKLMALDPTKFTTRPDAKRHTQNLTYGAEGIMDTIGAIMKGIMGGMTRMFVATGRFFKVVLPSLGRVNTMCIRLLDRVKEARSSGLSAEGLVTRSANVAKINAYMMERDLGAILRTRNDATQAVLGKVNTLTDGEGMVESALDHQSFVSYMNDKVIPAVTANMTVFDSSSSRLIIKSNRNFEKFINPTVYVTEPLTLSGDRLFVGVNQAFNKDRDDTNMLLYEYATNGLFAAGVSASAKASTFPKESPVLDLDTIESLLQAVLESSDADFKDTLAAAEEANKKLIAMLSAAIAIAESGDGEQIDPGEKESILKAVLRRVEITTKALVTAGSIAFIVSASRNNSLTLVEAIVGSTIMLVAGTSAVRQVRTPLKRSNLVTTLQNLSLNLTGVVKAAAVETGSAFVADSRLIVRAAYDSLREYGVIKQKSEISDDDSDLNVQG